MAVNQKVIYATDWTTHAGVIYKPGDQMTDRAPEHAIRGAQEAGLASESSAAAERSARAEQERQQRVTAEQQERSDRSTAGRTR